MGMIIAGLIVWSVVHLYPAAATRSRDGLVARMGNNAYRGVFSLAIVAALVLIVLGWKAARPTAVYTAPLAQGPIVSGLMLVAFVLFVAAQARTNIKRILRHPQLTGVIVWAAAHLLANGDSRSVVLFGGLGLWAALEIALINRRDGAWIRPTRASPITDAIVLAVGLAAFGVVLYFHGWLFGVSPAVI